MPVKLNWLSKIDINKSIEIVPLHKFLQQHSGYEALKPSFVIDKKYTTNFLSAIEITSLFKNNSNGINYSMASKKNKLTFSSDVITLVDFNKFIAEANHLFEPRLLFSEFTKTLSLLREQLEIWKQDVLLTHFVFMFYRKQNSDADKLTTFNKNY